MVSRMASVDRLTGEATIALRDGWCVTVTPAGAAATPADLDANADRLPARVPGTVAGALRDAGHWSADAPGTWHDSDAWWRVRPCLAGAFTLRLRGLATIADVWLDGVRLLYSDNMFHRHEVPVTLRADSELAICCRALGPVLARRGRRPRWKAALVAPPTLRHVRTTLLGHMPGWCPEVQAAGPWRAVELVAHGKVRVRGADLRTRLTPHGGEVSLRLSLDGATTATLYVDGARADMAPGPDGALEGTVVLPAPPLWWPHTHGEQPLLPVWVQAGDTTIDLGRTGFRTLAVDRGADGADFTMLVNGQPVFCRGACWSTADLVTLASGREACAPWLKRLRDAGMNMVRVPGCMTYPGPEFFRLCDEMGILVWQDFMFASLDYPADDPDFTASVQTEAAQFLGAIQASPSLAILCGASEVAQQAAMLGLPEAASRHKLFDQVLPELCATLRPDVPYLAHTPSGGALPFAPEAGVAHYYGVGAYLRPPEDARRSFVRFAAECLAFANVPDQATLDEALPVPPVHDPRWKQRVPRDREAAWDFEDVRDHYLRTLLGIDPAALRRADPVAYLRASRIASAAPMQAAFAEWRRPGSSCHGALVWLLQDVWPGAGWGIIDSLGRPKSPWYALKEVLRPVQVLLSDEGLNGLHVHLLNETPAPVHATLSLRCLRDGATPVWSAEAPLDLPPRSAVTRPAWSLADGFFDTTLAYRFGPPSHDATIATLSDEAGGVLSETCHVPAGQHPCPAEIEACLDHDARGWVLHLTASRLAHWVSVEDAGFEPDAGWFHLPPGRTRVVRLSPRDPCGAARPHGEVHALNASRPARYAAASGLHRSAAA
jgi:beta-mannosidase